MNPGRLVPAIIIVVLCSSMFQKKREGESSHIPLVTKDQSAFLEITTEIRSSSSSSSGASPQPEEYNNDKKQQKIKKKARVYQLCTSKKKEEVKKTGHESGLSFVGTQHSQTHTQWLR